MPPRELALDSDWFADWMRDWVNWQLSVTGYGDATSLWRAMASQGISSRAPTSQIPAGVEPPAAINSIQRAFNSLLTSEHGRDVYAVKLFWVLGGGTKKGIGGVREALGCSERKAYELVKVGTAAMKSYLRALHEK